MNLKPLHTGNHADMKPYNTFQESLFRISIEKLRERKNGSSYVANTLVVLKRSDYC